MSATRVESGKVDFEADMFYLMTGVHPVGMGRDELMDYYEKYDAVADMYPYSFYQELVRAFSEVGSAQTQ